MGHKPVRIAKIYAFRGIDAQQIRWQNFKRWRIDAKTGSKRGPRCPGCRKRKPCFKTDLCKTCYWTSQRKGRPSGPAAPGWKGGRTLTPDQVRLTPQYRAFRRRILKRDKYRCTKCGAERVDGAKLEVDHVVPQAARKDLILDESNARTLCVTCHQGTDTWGNRAKYHRHLERKRRRDG